MAEIKVPTRAEQAMKRLNLEVLRPFLENQHPAIESGASHYANLQLTAIPIEIRAKIYALLLSKAQYLDDGAIAEEAMIHVTATRDTRSLCRDRNHCSDSQSYMEVSRPDRTSCYAIGPPGTTSILRVCQQMHREGAPYLYRDHTFVIEDTLDFSDAFINHRIRGIGAVNARSIKSIIIVVREDLEHEYRLSGPKRGRNIGVGRPPSRLVDILCTELPELQSLTMKTRDLAPQMTHYHLIGDWPKERRCILSLAAHITQDHPVLRKAIGSARCGHQHTNHWANTVYSNVRFEVKITAAVETKKISFGRAMDIDEGATASKDVILDCAEIRRTPWQELPFRRNWEYGLPDTATSSEPEGDGEAAGETSVEDAHSKLAGKFEAHQTAITRLLTYDQATYNSGGFIEVDVPILYKDDVDAPQTQ